MGTWNLLTSWTLAVEGNVNSLKWLLLGQEESLLLRQNLGIHCYLGSVQPLYRHLSQLLKNLQGPNKCICQTFRLGDQA